MTDFIQYWSTFRALLAGLNPYDPAVQLSIQQTINPLISVPMMSWNPPWLSILLAPVLMLPYEYSLFVWRILTVIFFLLSAILMLETYKSREKYYFLFCIPLVAIYESYLLGQLGGLLSLSVALLFYGTLKRSTCSSVLGCLIASLKPHLFVVYCFVIFTRKEFWRVGLISLTTVLAVALSAELIFPNSILLWLQSLLYPTTSIATFETWASASIAGMVISLLNFKLPAYVYMLIGIVLGRFFIREITPLSLSILFSISYMFSGYGWVFDQVLFAPFRLIALQFGFIPILFVDALGMYSRFYLFKYQHEFFWYALLQILVCFWLINRSSKKILGRS